jgi:hypothetical protein
VKAFARINTLPAALLKHAPSHLHRLHWRRPDAARSTTSTPLANTNQPPGPTTMVTLAQGLFLRDKKTINPKIVFLGWEQFFILLPKNRSNQLILPHHLS